MIGQKCHFNVGKYAACHPGGKSIAYHFILFARESEANYRQPI